MKRGTLVIDLETVPDPALPFTAKKPDAFPPSPCHQIVAIGAALLDVFGRVRRLWMVDGATELDLLLALVGFLNAQFVQRSGLTLAGFNTRSFDLPVIVARCLRYGLAFPWFYRERGARYRFSAEGHLDLMDFLADHGAGRVFSLDLAARLVGMPGKVGCDGGDVARLVAEGRLEEVRAYCLSDVAQTVAVLLRTQLLRGELTHDAYAAAVRSLLGAIERDARLAPLLPRIDLERLLALPEREQRAA
jgi:3'-5' exonuclease